MLEIICKFFLDNLSGFSISHITWPRFIIYNFSCMSSWRTAKFLNFLTDKIFVLNLNVVNNSPNYMNLNFLNHFFILYFNIIFIFRLFANWTKYQSLKIISFNRKCHIEKSWNMYLSFVLILNRICNFL